MTLPKGYEALESTSSPVARSLGATYFSAAGHRALQREALVMKIHKDQTRQIAQRWKVSPYYDRAEKEDWMDAFWNPRGRFRPLFDGLHTRTVVELACGRGRHTAHILGTPELCDRLKDIYLMDVNEENITSCVERFCDVPFVHPMVNTGYDFQPLKDRSVTAIFCYDAMVHFECDAVMSYLEDAYRILVPGGRALFHHSNYDQAPGAKEFANPHWRNFMSKNLFAHIAIRAGFKILQQFLMDWDEMRNLDCISLIEKREGLEKVTWVDRPQQRMSERILRKSRKILLPLYAGAFRDGLRHR
jgi:SAM-dependent methyltransferase